MPKKVRGESVKKEERGEGARGAPRSRAPWWWREGARPGGARGGMGSGIMETGWIFETGWIIAGLRAGGRAGGPGPNGLRSFSMDIPRARRGKPVPGRGPEKERVSAYIFSPQSKKIFLSGYSPALLAGNGFFLRAAPGEGER